MIVGTDFGSKEDTVICITDGIGNVEFSVHERLEALNTVERPVHVVGSGHSRGHSKSMFGGMALAAMLAISGGLVGSGPLTSRMEDDWDRLTKNNPVNTGRRAQKAHAAMTKAQLKRDRKAAKRIKDAA